MKKVLVIASVLFASATVFGMNQESVQMKEFSAINYSENMIPLSPMKDNCCKLLDYAKNQIKDCSWLTEDAKLLYSNLKFEDVWNQMELVL